MADADVKAALDTITAAVDSLQVELGVIHQRLTLLTTAVDRMIWRNVVPLDAGMLGVSHQLGWLVVPQEEYRSLLYLADGIGVHEGGTIQILEALIRPGDTVIDIGAHIGLLSLPIARCVGPDGRLIAIEPNERSAECLRRVLISNGMESRSQVLQVAASHEDAQMDYFHGENSMLGSLLNGESHPSVPVAAAKVDSLIPGGTRVDLVKIDVEGFEINALSGMQRLISDNHDIFVIVEFGPDHLERYGVNPGVWFDHFFRAGLNCFVCIDETTGQCDRRTIADLVDVYSINLLFYAHDNVRQDRLWPLMKENGNS